MASENILHIDIENNDSVVITRRAGKEMAREIGFGMADQTRLATAISELVRNVLQHGGGKGQCKIENLSDQQWLKIKVEVVDQGPGIADINQALTDRFSTAGSMGAGLPGTKRIVQDFQIQSEPGCTLVSIVISRKR